MADGERTVGVCGKFSGSHPTPVVLKVLSRWEADPGPGIRQKRAESARGR